MHLKAGTDTPVSVVIPVSVIIPALNEAKRIDAAVRSARDAGAAEVIVVDGGSDDDTPQFARNAGARLVESRPGRGTQIAAGVSASNGQIIVVLHADNRLAAGALSELDVETEDAATLWGGFRQHIEAPGWLYRLLEFGNAARIRYLGVVLGDQAMFVGRELLDQVGGFAELPLMEDVEISRRLRGAARPRLLSGPVRVDARRWQKRGVLRQTALNWKILILYRMGMSESRLAKMYRR